MKKILNFVKQRWFISLLGVIALGLFIWFIGPLFAFAEYAPLEEEVNRWYLIGFVFFLWLAVRGWSYYKSKKQNSQIMAAMAGGEEAGLSADEQMSQDEVKVLQERMAEALGVLKQSRLGRGPDRRFLYQLPWYIIIGPPGAGKTTLLKNSSLKFPLSDQFGKDAVRGVGGTRNCDWWFAEDAVLLDTAGRYTTHDSHESVDQAAWFGFLDLLKKKRSRRPINGIIIAVSLSDLLEQNGEQSLAQARAIRERIQELHERFNIHFPVYLLFTKCDLLAGFMEFFDDLDREDRAQVWGMTFKLDEQRNQNAIEQFKSEFGLLEEQLQNQLLDKLERERGRERRNQIYTFPQQFNSLNGLVVPFLEELFQSSRYAHEAMFRGVYFTSATQEGSPIDRMMGALSNSFGLDHRLQAELGGQGKSFFINNLLQKVIFAESGLAGTNLKLEKKRQWFQHGAFVGVAVVTVLMAVAWVTSYVSNKTYINDVSAQTLVIEEKIKAINLDDIQPLSILPLLNDARAISGGYAAQNDSIPFSLGFGLYQGDKLGDASIVLYRRLLKDVLLPRMMIRIEKQLQSNTNNADYLYEALKVYLMLAKSDHYDSEAIEAWFSLDWDYNLPIEVTTDQREALHKHLLALLEQGVTPLPRPINRSLVKQTQDLLQNISVAERVYSSLKLELKKNAVASYIVNEQAGRDATLVFESKKRKLLTTGVPGLFTCVGYKDVFLKNKERFMLRQTQDNWVLGIQAETRLSASELKELDGTILQLYFKEYIKYWDELLEDIQIKAFSNQTQMVEILKIISGKHSPLKLFLESVDLETSMSCLNKEDKSIAEKVGDKFNSARSSLGKIISDSSENQTLSKSGNTTNIVTDYFRGLHEMVQSKEGVPPRLDHTLSVLNELYVYINSILHLPGDELVTEQIQQILKVVDKVKLEGKRSPFPINGIMEKVANNSQNLVSGGVRKHINAMWRADVLPFCRKAIQGLYPIGKRTREITFDDFTFFFAPGGLMDVFFNKYLSASVERGGKNWRWNSRGAEGDGISYAALKQFQRADNIKNIFFRMGKLSPKVSFKLKPINMSPAIVQLIMDVDGQSLTYAHGPIKPVAMKWPGPNDSGQVRIQLLPPLQGYSGLSKEGPWALFRLFDEAHIIGTTNPAIFIMTFNIQDREAKFELRANSAVNPFQLSDLHSFQCPASL